MTLGVGGVDVILHHTFLYSLKEAADFVHSVQSHEGLYIGCPEEAAYREGYIGKDILIERAEALSHCAYGRYLKALTEATYLQEGRIV